MVTPSPGPLSVVVPTRDRAAFLATCLAALAGSLRPDDDLIVVDSASRDPDVRRVALDAGARVVRCDLPGASLARNAGAAHARHPLVAFVDDDVEVTPGWAAAMAGALGRDGVGFVCGRVTLPPGDPGGLRQIAIKDAADPAWLDPTTPAPLGASANLGVRRAVLGAVGGFDEALGGGGRFHAAEDTDLFDRLLAAGHRGWYEPDALAHHAQWRTRRELLRLDWRYGIGLGARLAKLARTDRRRARKAFGEAMWGDGLRVVGRAARDRHEFLVATTGLRMAASVVGAVRAVAQPLDGGRYAPTTTVIDPDTGADAGAGTGAGRGTGPR